MIQFGVPIVMLFGLGGFFIWAVATNYGDIHSYINDRPEGLFFVASVIGIGILGGVIGLFGWVVS